MARRLVRAARAAITAALGAAVPTVPAAATRVRHFVAQRQAYTGVPSSPRQNPAGREDTEPSFSPRHTETRKLARFSLCHGRGEFSVFSQAVRNVTTACQRRSHVPEERRWSIARHLKITQQRFGDVAVVSLDGWLVADEQDIRFRNCIDAIVSEGIANIVVDLHDVTLLDSGGIGVLVAKLLTLRKRGGDLRLARLSDRTRRVLSITHLLTAFAAFDSPEHAVRSFTSDPPHAARLDESGPSDEISRRR